MTLEDIYRQIKNSENEEKEDDSEVAADTLGGGFEGEVTGYAVPLNHGPEKSPAKMGSSGYGGGSYGGYGGMASKYITKKF